MGNLLSNEPYNDSSNYGRTTITPSFQDVLAAKFMSLQKAQAAATFSSLHIYLSHVLQTFNPHFSGI